MKRTEKQKDISNKVWAQVEVTINFGNYENVKFAAGISYTLLDNEDPFDIRTKLMKRLRKDIFEEVKEIRQRKGR